MKIRAEALAVTLALLSVLVPATDYVVAGLRVQWRHRFISERETLVGLSGQPLHELSGFNESGERKYSSHEQHFHKEPSASLLDLPKKARSAFDRYKQESQFQHAIWILSEFGYWDRADVAAAKLENLLESLPIKKIEPWDKHGDTVEMKRVYLQEGLEALYKPAQTEGHYGAGAFARREVAAYAVNQLLHIAVVPATVLRTLEGHREPGSLQILVKGAKVAGQRRDTVPLIRFFDSLISNTDSWSRNMLELNLYEGHRKFIAIDHNQAFFRQNAAVRPPNDEIRQRLRELDDATLDEALGNLLTAQEMSLLKEKRDAILALE